jgi:hypothetical protein
VEIEYCNRIDRYKKEKIMDNDQLLAKWKDLPIKKHIRISETYIIFINEDDEFDWKVDGELNTLQGYDNLKFNKLYNRLSEIELLDININEPQIKRRFKELIANALVNIFECDYANAEIGIEKALAFINKKNYEITRIWTLLSTTITSLILFSIGLLFLLNYNGNEIIKTLIYSMCGSIGVLIITFINLNKTDILIESGCLNICIESSIRVFVGVFISFIGLLLIKFKLILPQISESKINDWELVVAVLLAPCEKLVPKVFGKFEQTILEEKNDGK